MSTQSKKQNKEDYAESVISNISGIIAHAGNDFVKALEDIRVIIIPQGRRDNMFTNRATGITQPNSMVAANCTDLKINIIDVLNYIPDLADSLNDSSDNDWGFRIYPGYEAGKVIFLVAVARYADDLVDYNGLYFKLYQDCKGSGQFTHAGAVPYSPAIQQIYNDYFANVGIEGQRQMNNNYLIKKSRFYTRGEIVSYLCSQGVNLETTPLPSNIFLKFQWAYINYQDSDLLYTSYGEPRYYKIGTTNYRYHQGITILLTLVTETVVGDILSSESLEIAKPCPPKCSTSLQWP